VASLEAAGYRVRIGRHALNSEEPSSATRQARLDDLTDFLTDDKVDAIMAFVGGYAAVQLVGSLDYGLVARSPKLLIGYSDLTAIQLAIFARVGVPSVYGPAALPQFGEAGGIEPYTFEAFERIVSGTTPPIPLARAEAMVTESLRWDIDDDRPRRAVRAPKPRTVRDGEVAGTLLAANLDTLLLLAGTPFLPAFDDIVLAVEVENTSTRGRVIRQLEQLRLIGCFDKIAGLIVGRLPPVVEIGTAELANELLSVTSERPIPVVVDLPFGHTDPIASLPIGGTVRVDARRTDPTVTITDTIVTLEDLG
jgi:muramoyltetrapeptide carboxypeptidase